LSRVACQNERRKAAQRFNKPLEEIPLKFGSVRMAVNKIQLTDNNEDTTTYRIDKSIKDENIREQRLILEISYKYDYKQANSNNINGPIIKDHDVVDELKVGKHYSLYMKHSCVKEKHYMKLINPSQINTIKSYFLKAWANDITFLSPPELPDATQYISPQDVVINFNINPQLVIV